MVTHLPDKNIGFAVKTLMPNAVKTLTVHSVRTFTTLYREAYKGAVSKPRSPWISSWREPHAP
jgi:hypothetical protein